MDSLIDAETLKKALSEGGDIFVLDASSHLPDAERDARAEFADAHIPGARFLDLGSFFDVTSSVPKAVPSAEQFAQRMGSLGIGSETSVVLYDDSIIKPAFRAWFIMQLYGLEASVLDGGLAAWKQSGGALESGMPETSRRDFPVPEQGAKVRSKAEMLANIDSEAEQVIDARDAARFAGTAPPDAHGLPSGHIPGSRNLFFRDLLNEDGTFRSREELARAFREAGIDPDGPVVTTCGSGVTASILLFALHLLGNDDAKLYDGSWLEWASDPGTPRETSAAA
ncbi:sulfurtransferase [Qipengyuania atrilutea]|uniref:Sulfurtransferase n=1 Tax=Qipengyuania atrilutea TaxID=2744473 RepID=A0A850H995_9SPHN|nr:sulfurtransferase [Actirhodobacter atriluteus]NVD45865.1 sulfurtransferase [Actirhodobacter atriluteus]